MILPDFKDFPHIGRLLGIDWGARRVGLAVSDESWEFVFTRPQIDGQKTGACAVDQIKTLISDEKIVGIVIGLPRHGDGSESETTRAVYLFANEIAASTNLPVVFINEELTSHEAAEHLTGMTRGAIKKRLDSESAKIILENAIALLRRRVK